MEPTPTSPAPSLVPDDLSLVPDSKDWTWTLIRRCDECGLTAGDVDVASIPEWAEASAVEWVQILTSSPAVTARPAPEVWSPLEYGAHVRDVYRLFDSRLATMLAEENPTFDNWDQNETAVAERYEESDPDEVAAELGAAAASFVARLRGVTAEQLIRTGKRSDGAEFTVTSFAQYFLHDIVHHLWDVTGQRATDLPEA